jgi:hypothetical protein
VEAMKITKQLLAVASNLTGVRASAPGACVLISHWEALPSRLAAWAVRIRAVFCMGLAWGWYGCAASDKPAYWTPIMGFNPGRPEMMQRTPVQRRYS